MAKIITALYETTAEAKAVQTQLQSLGIVKDDDDASGQVMDRSSPDYRAGAYSTQEDRGIWRSQKHMSDGLLPDDDRHSYEEGVHRGHALLTVTVDDETEARVREVIELSDPIDVHAKRDEWRSQGWTEPTKSSPQGSERYYNSDLTRSSSRWRTYHTDTGNGPGATSYGASGAADNAIGNIKQAVGTVTGSEMLQQKGQAQERKGEGEMRDARRKADEGNEL